MCVRVLFHLLTNTPVTLLMHPFAKTSKGPDVLRTRVMDMLKRRKEKMEGAEEFMGDVDVGGPISFSPAPSRNKPAATRTERAPSTEEDITFESMRVDDDVVDDLQGKSCRFPLFFC